MDFLALAKESMAVNDQLVSWAAHMLLVWLLGLSLGWLLPRPSWLRRAKDVVKATRPLAWSARIALLVNALMVLRELWHRIATPGTARSFLLTAWIQFRERCFGPSYKPSTSSSDSHSLDWVNSISDSKSWYITTDDLQQLLDVVELDKTPPGASAWESFCGKSWDSVSYIAWRRSLPTGKTEYKSVTVAQDTTPEEFMDFYLDDDVRPQWDGMITEHSLLEQGPVRDRRQVVRWLRSFAFSFISKREYIIARRVFRAPNGDLYGITKGIDHPAAPHLQGIVRMESFYSMWRCRAVECPNGSGLPATETTLLHFEDFRIPENLARFAVRHGMLGFVGKMVPFVRQFVKQRRSRTPPNKPDPKAYGYAAKSGIQRTASLGNEDNTTTTYLATSSSSRPGSTTSLEDSASEHNGHMTKSPSVRRLGYMLLASGVAIAIGRTGSMSRLASGSSDEHEDFEDEQQQPTDKMTATRRRVVVSPKEMSSGVRSHRLAISSSSSSTNSNSSTSGHYGHHHRTKTHGVAHRHHAHRHGGGSVKLKKALAKQALAAQQHVEAGVRAVEA